MPERYVELWFCSRETIDWAICCNAASAGSLLSVSYERLWVYARKARAELMRSWSLNAIFRPNMNACFAASRAPWANASPALGVVAVEAAAGSGVGVQPVLGRFGEAWGGNHDMCVVALTTGEIAIIHSIGKNDARGDLGEECARQAS